MGKYNKIFVLATYNFATGGVELAHQLVDYLRNKGQEAFIVYVKGGDIETIDLSITPAYSRYNIKVSPIVEDSSDNILILPEVFFEFILKYKAINIGCWWMSVNNRYNCVAFSDYLSFIGSPLLKVRALLSHYILGHHNDYKNSNNDLIRNKDRIIHLYQSHYAYKHILSLGITKVMPLSDYINTDFSDFETIRGREDIILYNPVKGMKYTKRIIKKLPNCHFVALKGFSREGLVDIMNRSKIYIDFGEFPGKDRLPREAVMNGCCIITGKHGASQYYEDVPINDSYKFSTRFGFENRVAKKIKYVLDNYEECYKDFGEYRETIMREKEKFYNEIENIFF